MLSSGFRLCRARRLLRRNELGSMILSVSRQNDEQSHDTPRSESIYEK